MNRRKLARYYGDSSAPSEAWSSGEADDHTFGP